MPKLIPMYCDEENTILVEATEDVEIEGEEASGPIRDVSVGEEIDKAVKALHGISTTINGYCAAVMKTFRDMGESIRPDRAVIEFGIQLSAEGNAFVVKGSTQANLKVTAEWKFSSDS